MLLRDVVPDIFRFTKYTDWLYTQKDKGVVFRFIHSGTWFKKIAFSGSQNAGTIIMIFFFYIYS